MTTMSKVGTGTVDFGLADGLGYMLDRNHVAATRLNIQHYLWKDSMKFLLHPSIPVSSTSAIADIATGTGIWLIELARELPNASLAGSDIDLSQVPPEPWLPSNVTMRKWNIFDDVPSDMEERYDIIHVRLLVLVIQNSDPGSVVKNLRKMLKPGGYLQWDELNCADVSVKKVNEDLETPALNQLKEMSYANGRYNWTLQLPNFMQDEGLVDSQMYHFDDHLEMARAIGEQHLMTMEEFAIRLLRENKKEAAVQFFTLIKQAYQESTTGASLCFPRIVCVARRAFEGAP